MVGSKPNNLIAKHSLKTCISQYPLGSTSNFITSYFLYHSPASFLTEIEPNRLSPGWSSVTTDCFASRRRWRRGRRHPMNRWRRWIWSTWARSSRTHGACTITTWADDIEFSEGDTHRTSRGDAWNRWRLAKSLRISGTVFDLLYRFRSKVPGESSPGHLIWLELKVRAAVAMLCSLACLDVRENNNPEQSRKFCFKQGLLG